MYKPQFRQKRKRSRSPAGPRRLGTATRISASLSRRLSAFFGSTPDQGAKAAKFAVLTPGHAGFPNRVKRSEGSDTTPPRTFRKYCAQSEKTATSPSCKQITQPSGAATPSDTHKRIAVPKAFCVLREHTRPRPKSGKVRRSDTRPGEVCECAERSEGSDTTPIRNATCFTVCAVVCDPLSRAECVPAFTRESERGPFVREAEKCDEMRFGTALCR